MAGLPWHQYSVGFKGNHPIGIKLLQTTAESTLYDVAYNSNNTTTYTIKNRIIIGNKMHLKQ